MNIIIPMALVLYEVISPSGVFNNPVHYAEQAKNVFISPLNLLSLEEDGFIRACKLETGAPISYEEIKYEAIFNCKFNKNPNSDLIDLLVEVERSFNVPPAMRGMLLSAACMESGYNPAAKGDRKFSKNKKTPMAIGILQQWPIYKKMFPGMKRTDPRSAATTWMQHIVNRIPKVKRQCKYKTDAKIWLAAWVTGIRSKKVGGRCKERPNHYRLLKKWHKNIRKLRTETYECYDPGC